MHINIQPAEKLRPAQDLEVHSIFYTIQGEGPFCGQPAVFVRLAGCNLQCPGCDTEYTAKRLLMDKHEIAEEIELVLREANPTTSIHKPIVVITGGEPFRQNISPLTRSLVMAGFHVQVETNGTLRPISEAFLSLDALTIVCSPKTGKINPVLLPFIDAFKYVLHAESVHPDDGLPTLALGHSASPRVARPPEGNVKPVYLQPMDSGNERDNKANLEACIDSCLRYGYTLQLQVHKIIDME